MGTRRFETFGEEGERTICYPIKHLARQYRYPPLMGVYRVLANTYARPVSRPAYEIRYGELHSGGKVPVNVDVSALVVHPVSLTTEL